MIPKELSRFKLTNAEAPKVRRLVAVCFGATKTGKTSLMLRTAPRPLLVVNLDLNLEPLESAYVEDQDLMVKTICIPRDGNQSVDKEIWNDFRDLYETVTTKSLVRSVLIDTGTELRRLLVRAEVGNLEFGDNGFSQAHGRVKERMRWVFTQAKATKTNMLMTHREADEYTKGKSRANKEIRVKSGDVCLSGWEEAPYEAQLYFRMYKEAPNKEEQTPLADRYKLKILGCNANPDCEDEILSGEEIDWAVLGKMACPWSSYSDWRT